MSAFYTAGESSSEESNLRVIAHAHELGITMLDTAGTVAGRWPAAW